MFNSEVLTAIAVAPLLVAGMCGVGGKLLHLSRIVSTEDEALRFFPVSVALGFSVYSYLGYILALFAPVSPLSILALVAISIGIGFSYWRLFFKAARESIKRFFPVFKTPLFWLFAVLSAGVLFLAAMKWLTPPNEGDALWGYMFTARWLSTNGLTFIPYNPRYSLFPLNTETVYAFSFAFGTDLIAKLLDGLLGLCFLAAIYELARRCGISRMFAFFAAASLAILPEFINNWASGKVDITSCFVFFAGVSLLLWKHERLSKYVIVSLATFLLGTACSQKYTFWIFVVAFPVWIFLVFKASTKTELAKMCLLFTSVLALTLIPHFVKNIVWAGNPIAPFAQNVFNPNVIILPHVSDSYVWQWQDNLIFLKTLFFSGSKLGPFPLLILLGLPLYFFIKNKPALVKIIFALGVVQLATWILVRQSDWLNARFLFVQIALLLVVSVYGLDYFSGKYKTAKIALIMAMLVLMSFVGVWSNRHKRAHLAYITGAENRAEWQENQAPGRAFAILNSVAPKLNSDARLMAIDALYNIPEEKIPYVGTEAEFVEFLKTPDDQKVDFLKNRKIRFYLNSTARKPEWTNKLRIVESKDVPGLEWTMYEIEPE